MVDVHKHDWKLGAKKLIGILASSKNMYSWKISMRRQPTSHVIKEVQTETAEVLLHTC